MIIFEFFSKFKENLRFRGLRGRMLLLAVLPLLLMVLVTIFVDTRIQELSKKLNYMVNDVAPGLTTSKELNIEISNIKGNIWSSLANQSSSDLLTESVISIESSVERFESALDRYKSLKMPPKAATLRDVSVSKWATVKPAVTSAIDALKNKKFEDVKKDFFSIVKPNLDNLELALSNVELNNSEMMESETNQAAHIAVLTRASSAIAVLAVLILSFLISMFITIFTVKPLTTLSEVLSGESVSSRERSTQIADTTQALTNSATEAAASIEETAASLEELSSMVKLTSKNASDAAILSGKAYEEAVTGEREIGKLVSSIQDIAQSSKRVEEIVTVLDDISFQTNLLALNAAVEAARAGEHGKGFAVVADAVRSLAQKSSESAKEISTLIHESSNKMQQGTELAGRSGILFSQIVTAIKKVVDINKEISDATDAQAEGISGINIAMNQLDKSSQNNAQVSEQIASTFTAAKKQADDLEIMVIDLQKVIEG